MGFVKLFGWVLLVGGVGTMASPLLSSMTGFAVANIGLTVPHISFSSTTLVIGGISALVGLFIVRPEKKSIVERL